jgi:hypothetical protein
MRASDLSLDTYNTFLFKAPPGFGKTLAAASFALLGPTYLAYFDKKSPIELKTYFTEKRFGDKAKRILDNIEYDVYGGHNAHQYLNFIIKQTQGCRYVNIITDSVTSLTASAVNWSMGFRDANKGHKADPKNKEAPMTIPDFDEYKVETSLVSQAIDLSRTLPCNIIWLAHPLPSIKIEGSGASIKVTKTNPIVTYGSKVAGMIPGNFTEIYHFGQKTTFDSSGSKKSYIVSLEAIGDEFAKSPLLGDYIKELDITDKLFYEVWKDAVDASQGKAKMEEAKPEISNPFNSQTKQWKV